MREIHNSGMLAPSAAELGRGYRFLPRGQYFPTEF